jgi:hypothetical protein
MPDKPLETYHPETTHLTATRSCEAYSAFTRVAARTCAPSPICDRLHRRLQPFRHLHDCSGCFRLERSGRVGLAPTGKRRLHGARKERSSRRATVCFAAIWRKHLSAGRRVETATGAGRNLMTIRERSARAGFRLRACRRRRFPAAGGAHSRGPRACGSFGTEVTSTVHISN